jgi:N-acetylmuramoyl-L-alanine amidase
MKTVFLNSGHGGADPGAVSGDMLEKNINLVAMLKCKEELERHNVKVVCSKVKDEDDKLVEVVKEANSSGADIAVSFHANAGGGDGFEAFYYTTSSSGKKLASLGEKYVKELGQNSRGLKSGNHLYFIKNTKAPAVLFESFFVDNVNDRTIGDTLIEQQAFGIAYAKAILEYFGIEYKAEETKIYRVQVGAFSKKENAENLVKDLKAKGYNAVIV